MEQGPDLYENQELSVSPGDIDFVLLTHAHIDHSGNLPLLCKKGFKGEIVTTFATADLCGIMLRDSAHIQVFEAQWRNRKARRSGDALYEPIYDMKDADAAIKLLAPCDYNQKITLCEGIEIRFQDIGHLLGSASIEVWITEDGVTKKIVFSGDVGNTDQPIIKDPTPVKEADYVVIESTYGGHNDVQPSRADASEQLGQYLQQASEHGGKVLVPVFAVGRSQEVMLVIEELMRNGRIPKMPVYLDGMIWEATAIHTAYPEYLNSQLRTQIFQQNENPFLSPIFKRVETSDMREEICHSTSASGRTTRRTGSCSSDTRAREASEGPSRGEGPRSR